MAIDPLGVIGPREFEYTIAMIIEAKANRKKSVETYWDTFHYFEKYSSAQKLYAASFFTWVHKMDEYVFVKHDNFQEAQWAVNMIKTIFFEGKACKKADDYYLLFCKKIKCIG